MDDPNCVVAGRLHYGAAAARDQGISGLIYDDGGGASIILANPASEHNKTLGSGRKRQFRHPQQRNFLGAISRCVCVPLH